MVKERVKNAIRVLSPSVVRNLPIASRPGWLGRVHGVKIPTSLPVQSQPAPTGRANINILTEMIERTKFLSGAFADVGVYQAGSTVGMALYLRQRRVHKRIYAFDSFEGFDPESVAKDMQLGGKKMKTATCTDPAAQPWMRSEQKSAASGLIISNLYRDISKRHSRNFPPT
jgi:hypothetical protein